METRFGGPKRGAKSTAVPAAWLNSGEFALARMMDGTLFAVKKQVGRRISELALRKFIEEQYNAAEK